MRTTLMLLASLAVIGCNRGKNGEDSYSFGGSQEPTQKNGAVTPVEKPTTKQAEPKKWTRQELSQAVAGKTQDEVIAMLGNPDSTNLGEFNNNFADKFFYNRLVIDPASKKYIPAYVRFNGPKAVACGLR